MTIIECESTREIPSTEMWMPQTLTKSYSVSDAISDYVKRFGVEPVTGYHWGSYLYIEKPKGG